MLETTTICYPLTSISCLIIMTEHLNLSLHFHFKGASFVVVSNTQILAHYWLNLHSKGEYMSHMWGRCKCFSCPLAVLNCKHECRVAISINRTISAVNKKLSYRKPVVMLEDTSLWGWMRAEMLESIFQRQSHWPCLTLKMFIFNVNYNAMLILNYKDTQQCNKTVQTVKSNSFICWRQSTTF